MKPKRLRFLTFRAPDGTFELACLDAGTAGHGPTLMDAVKCLADNVRAGIELSTGSGTEFLRDPDDDELAIYEAVTHSRPAPRAALKSAGYSGKLVGTGELQFVTKPKPHIDIGHLESIGA